jgi:hypothetical protein
VHSLPTVSVAAPLPTAASRGDAIHGKEHCSAVRLVMIVRVVDMERQPSCIMFPDGCTDRCELPEHGPPSKCVQAS